MQRRAAFVKMQSQIKQFNATGLFTYTLKTRFSDVFKSLLDVVLEQLFLWNTPDVLLLHLLLHSNI